MRHIFNGLNPQSYFGTKTSLHDQKMLVWCAISANRVFGPYYFEDTVNQHNHLEMLKMFFWPTILRTAESKNSIFSKMVLDLIQLGQYKYG